MNVLKKEEANLKQKELLVELMNNSAKGNGLYYGNAGIILALNNYKNRCKTKNDITEKIETITGSFFENIFENFESEVEKTGWSFGFGMTGVLFVLNYIDKNAPNEVLLGEEQKEIINNIIFKNLKAFSNEDFEIFNGKLGLLNYLIYSGFSFDDNFLEDFSDGIVKVVGTKKEKINFGLAHGIPSLVVVFSKLYKLTKHKKVKQTLKILLEYLESYFDHKNIDSKYPSLIIDGKPEYTNRMAWCYGDLGICFALYIAGDALEKEFFCKKAITLFEAQLDNSNLGDLGITDNSFCHGVYGVSYLFNRFYTYSKQDVFKNASIKWLNDGLEFNFETYDFGPKAKDLVKMINSEKEKYLLRDTELSLLEGKSGELVIISSFLNDYVDDWDACFLLS